jgi:hypothetical protein
MSVDTGIISRDDIRAAVQSGIVSEAQAARLIHLADGRRGARENLNIGDEPFELFKGFNEIFIIVGLSILSFGWYSVIGVSVMGSAGWLNQWLIACLIAMAAIWALSEYFIRKRRMVGPAIFLSIIFAGNAATAIVLWLSEPFMIGQGDYSTLPLPLWLSTLAVAVYWWRFRVPFSLAIIALGLFASAIVYAASQIGRINDPSELFLLSNAGPFAWITLALGICTFAAAMYFDASDPHRVTRRAANGFWLHVVAAPMLINTIALTLLESGSNIALLGVCILFAVVAIVIDRRSFLITAIGYCIALTVTVMDGEGTAFSILIMGIALVLLGALWERIRAVLLRILAPLLPLNRLPPSFS